MSKQIIKSESFRKPYGSFSWGVKAGNFIFLTGLGGINVKGEIVGKNDAKLQTRQAFENIKTVLELAGAKVSNIIKTTTYLRNPSDWDKFNEVRTNFFKENSVVDNFPASTSLHGFPLREDVLVEIETVAYVE